MSRSTSSRATQHKAKEPELGPDYVALQNYVKDNYTNSMVSWSPGDPRIAGSEYQVHVILQHVKFIRKGMWQRAWNGQTVDAAAKNCLKSLMDTDKHDSRKDLEVYVNKYASQGFIVVSGDRCKQYGNRVKVTERYRVSVQLRPEVTKEHGEFCLGTDIGSTINIAARKVLQLLQFKETNGFLWVNENTFDEANHRYHIKEKLDKLIHTEKKGKGLSYGEQHLKAHLLEQQERAQFMWLDQPFQDKADYFEGGVPKLSEKLHKVLKEDGLEQEHAPLVAYKAIEAYRRVQEKKLEAKQNSKTTGLLKHFGAKKEVSNPAGKDTGNKGSGKSRA